MASQHGNGEQTIVVIEDDPAIADLVDMYLRNAGFRVMQAANGQRGLTIIDTHRPVFAVIDVGLPDIDGFEVCRQIRAHTSPAVATMPVLFLTARDDEMDRIAGFAVGADDYVTKPFSPREVVARVAAILRRGTAPQVTDGVARVGEVTIDERARTVTVGGRDVALALREFELLAYLARHQGQALSRQQLIDNVWGFDFDGDDRTVDVHIRQLRKKVGPELPLATVWGVGYRLG